MKRKILIIGSYVLTAAVAVGLTVLVLTLSGSQKLWKLQRLISQVHVEEVDWDKAQDAAAEAMVQSLPDGWSYYISAQEYESYQNDKENAYVGVGITVAARTDGTGIDILQVEPQGPAQQAGILPGDVLVQVDGQDVQAMQISQVAAMIQGEPGGQVELTVRRGEQTLRFALERSQIQRQVASFQMLEGSIGYISIANFNANSARQTIDAVKTLTEQGAKALIFDVRNNPGGYKDEMVQVLDHLLPEGDLFCSVDYRGVESVDTSDADCLSLPMAVLINGSSYSAAEFFAAALQEYDWAVTVGEPTVGKGHFQLTYPLGDGSAVALSVGKYFTPKGVNLSEAGGLVPQVEAAVDDKTAALIYSGLVEPGKDPQVQAAVDALEVDS